MSHAPLPVDDAFGPARRAVIRVLTVLFVVLLVLMLLLGTVLVLLQLGGLLSLQSGFIVAAEKALGPYTYKTAAALGTVSLFVALAHGWKSKD